MKILERLNPTNTGSYNRPIAHALGLGAAVVYAALINKQVYYEQRNMLDEDGFFYSTIADLQESTSMGKCQQSNAIKVLTDAGLVEACRRGMPAKRYFRVRDEVELLDKFLKQGEAIMNELNPIAQKCENVTSCSDIIVQQEVTNCNIKMAQNEPYTINHNINKSKENNPNLSIHGGDEMDRIDERNNYLELIRENIEYDCFEEKEQEQVDELVEIMLDVVCSTKETIRVISSINAHINELKKKPAEELTTEESTLINNQNDVMREKITELRQQFEDMSKKAEADFVPVSIYSPDKLQYIADGLARAKIPCVAESNTLYIPDYALKTAQAIASHYKPDEKAPTIREMIKLDIDRLVYRTETLDDLLYRLQERGCGAVCSIEKSW